MAATARKRRPPPAPEKRSRNRRMRKGCDTGGMRTRSRGLPTVISNDVSQLLTVPAPPATPPPAVVPQPPAAPPTSDATPGQFVTNYVPGGFKRRPRGTSEKIRKQVQARRIKTIKCSVPDCNHAGFSWANQGKADVPRGTDGEVLWHSLFHWTPRCSNNNYNNFLRCVRTHFVYEITVNNSNAHRLYCPAVLVDRAQKALNRTEDPATSTSGYRSLWEALQLNKGDPPPSSNV